MDNCPFTNNPCPNPKNMQVPKLENNIEINCDACQVCGPSYFLICQLKNNLNMFILQDASKLQKYICKFCGTSLTEIASKHFFGCPDCYDAHKTIALQIFSRCQKSCKHVGKMPKNFEDHYFLENIKEQIQILEEKIVKAVKVENYEIAAMLKNKIEELKKEIKDAK